MERARENSEVVTIHQPMLCLPPRPAPRPAVASHARSPSWVRLEEIWSRAKCDWHGPGADFGDHHGPACLIILYIYMYIYIIIVIIVIIVIIINNNCYMYNI